MSGFRKPPRPRECTVLFPTTLDQAVESDARVRLFSEILSSECFEKTFRRWEKDYVLVEGKPPFHPRALTALYLYGMMEGIRSSRRLEAACLNRVDVYWLLEGLAPDHSTIAGFVKKHGEGLHELFRDTLEVAAKMGLVRLQHVSVDGTKLEANASKSSVTSEADIQAMKRELDEEIKQRTAEWEANEAKERSMFREDEMAGEDDSVSPKKGAERAARKRDRMRSALETIERRRKETSSGGTFNPVTSTTDPDSRHMKDKEGNVKPCFNVQNAVDETAGLIVALVVNDRANDLGLLLPVIEQVKENLGLVPNEISADKGYNLGCDLMALENLEVVTFVPEQGNGKARTDEGRAAVAAIRGGAVLTEDQWKALPHGSNKKVSREAFVYDKAENTYRCPTGRILTPWKVHKDKQCWDTALRTEYRVEAGACIDCPFAKYCCENPAKGRTVTRDQYEDTRERVRQRMKTAEGKKQYAKRSPLAETPNAIVKGVHGIYRFLRRGIRAVRAEAAIIYASYNMAILIRHVKATRASTATPIGESTMICFDSG